jgi:hypothetical protein
MPVGLISRNRDRLEPLAAELTEAGNTADFESADIREPSALSSAIGALPDRLGPVEVLEYSPMPAREFMQPILETTVDDLRANNPRVGGSSSSAAGLGARSTSNIASARVRCSRMRTPPPTVTALESRALSIDARAWSMSCDRSRVHTIPRNRRHRAKHRLSPDCINWTPSVQLDPGRPSRPLRKERDLQEL